MAWRLLLHIFCCRMCSQVSESKVNVPPNRHCSLKTAEDDKGVGRGPLGYVPPLGYIPHARGAGRWPSVVERCSSPSARFTSQRTCPDDMSRRGMAGVNSVHRYIGACTAYQDFSSLNRTALSLGEVAPS